MQERWQPLGQSEAVQPDAAEIEFRQDTTIRQLLSGSEITEPEGNNLADAPVHVFTRQIGTTSTEYTAVVDYPLNGMHFLNLLAQAAPNNHVVGIEGVMGDWRMPDGNEKKLNSLHARGLGPSWQVFEQQRQLFMAALDTERHSAPEVIPYANIKDREDIYKELMRGGALSFNSNEFVNLFLGDNLADLRNQLAAFLKTDPKMSKRRNLDRYTTDQVLRRLNGASEKNQKRMLTGFLAQADPETRDILLQQYLKNVYEGFSLSDEDSGESRVIYANIRGGQYHVTTREGTYVVENNDFSAEAELRMRGKQLDYVIVPDTIIQSNVIIPTLRWRTRRVSEEPGDVLRDWVDEVPQGEIVNAVRPILEEHGIPVGPKFRNRINPLAGLLSIAYFSPDIVSKWPQSVGLPNGRYKQFMGAAQVPVLAHMMRKDLLESELIHATEQYAA